MSLLRVGDFIVSDSTLDPNETERALAIILDTDGSRRRASVLAFPVNEFIARVLGHPANRTPAIFWGYLGPYTINPPVNTIEGSFRVIPSYLPYTPDDRVAVPASWVPVNQIPQVRLWRSKTATFAHDLDIAHGSYLVDVTLSEEDRATLFLYGRMLAGAAWLALKEWELTDPQATFIRDGQTIIRWKDEQQISERIVAVMTEYRWWARRMAESANLPLFSVRLGHGHLPGVYRSIEPWVPQSPFVGQADIIGLLDPVEVANRIAAWQAENVAAWKVAVHHYDTVTALGPSYQ